MMAKFSIQVFSLTSFTLAKKKFVTNRPNMINISTLFIIFICAINAITFASCTDYNSPHTQQSNEISLSSDAANSQQYYYQEQGRSGSMINQVRPSQNPSDSGDQPINQRRNALNQHIKHFEPLSYDHQAVHGRAKRDLSSSEHSHPIAIDFEAHNHKFKIRLKPDLKSVFSDDFVLEDSVGNSIKDHIDMDMFALSGHLHDDPDSSKVYGSLKNGVFEGKIHTGEGKSFYVERANRYTDDLKKNSAHKEKDFHSIIYSADDVVNPEDLKKSGSHNQAGKHLPTIGGSCGHLDDKVKEWVETVSNSAVPGSEEEHLPKKPKDDIYERMNKLYGYSLDFSENYPTYKHDLWSAERNNHNRSKRQILGVENFDFSLGISPKPRVSTAPIDQPLKRRACSLYIQTDTHLWNHTRKHNENDRDTREDIASLVAQHIKAVNHIYENSDFNGIRGLKFIVQRLRINDTLACDNVRRPTNPFCLPNIDVSNFLNLNSQFNHNDFCLAYIFTYRDFSGGTLGLAWVASTSGASGGICEKYKSYTENVQGRQVQTKRSLNTGIITFVNYNSRVPPKVSELTLAHEIGHNFGSPHDYPADCKPGGPQGNYIMFSSATSGEKSNNNKFSPCSIRNISSVLHAILAVDNPKDNCFQEDDGPFCGNKIVEEGEDCDCGYDAKECTESCCYPREIQSSEYDRVGQPCRRRSGVVCSPSEGPCCNEECSFVGSEKVCRQETECSMAQSCNRAQATCPESLPKQNLTECNGGTQVCWAGQCTGSICQKYQLEECFLTAKSGAKAEEMCEVACQLPDQPHTCQRTSDISSMTHIAGLKLRPGSPCNDFQGYCDVFQRCRSVDAEGPLARLKNMLLNQRTLMTIKQWATTHWWACALFLIAFIMFMYVFIRCCAVHTPSSNPKKRPALRISETLRRPADTLRRKRRSHGHGPHSGSRSSSSGHRHHHHHHHRHGRSSHSSAHGHHSSSSSNSGNNLQRVGQITAGPLGKPLPAEPQCMPLQHQPLSATAPNQLVLPIPLPEENPPPYNPDMPPNLNVGLAPAFHGSSIATGSTSISLGAPSVSGSENKPSNPLPLMAKHGWHHRRNQPGSQNSSSNKPNKSSSNKR